jgi:hypothetical protein
VETAGLNGIVCPVKIAPAKVVVSGAVVVSKTAGV